MTSPILDRVHRLPRNGIRVVIIGAGIAGLQAALECWHNGSDVVVLERTDSLSPLGKSDTVDGVYFEHPATYTSFRRLFHHHPLGTDDLERLS
jgi:protoporphyrinogen oxidase